MKSYSIQADIDGILAKSAKDARTPRTIKIKVT
jgi:hypothetical protein